MPESVMYPTLVWMCWHTMDHGHLYRIERGPFLTWKDYFPAFAARIRVNPHMIYTSASSTHGSTIPFDEAQPLCPAQNWANQSQRNPFACASQ